MEGDDDDDGLVSEERAMFGFFALFVVVWFLLFALVHCHG